MTPDLGVLTCKRNLFNVLCMFCYKNFISNMKMLIAVADNRLKNCMITSTTITLFCFPFYELDMCRQHTIVRFILNLFSARGCKAPEPIICGGGVRQYVPVTASSWLNDNFSPQSACLDTLLNYKNGGETTLTEHERIRV